MLAAVSAARRASGSAAGSTGELPAPLASLGDGIGEPLGVADADSDADDADVPGQDPFHVGINIAETVESQGDLFPVRGLNLIQIIVKSRNHGFQFP